MCGAPGHGGLDALLVFAVAELHQRLLVEAQPRDAAILRRLHQRGGRRCQRAPLGVADEAVALHFPVWIVRRSTAQVRRQQRIEQRSASSPAAMPSSRCAYSYTTEYTPDAVVDAAGLAEGHVLAGDVLPVFRWRHVLRARGPA